MDRVCVLLVLLTTSLHHLLKPADAQTTTWTFNKPGVSRIIFSPPLTDSTLLHLHCSFRTVHANGVLMYVDIPDHSDDDTDISDLLDKFHMVVELRQGSVRVGHVFSHYKDYLTTGTALDDDGWHVLSVTVNKTSGELRVTVDGKSSTQVLKAFVWGNARHVLDWSSRRMTVNIGGSSGTSEVKGTSYIGCLRDLKYSTEGAALQAIPVDSREAVTPGCIDSCDGGDRCENRGRCINLYSQFRCDCFGTDYEGSICQQPGPTTLTLSGYEWVTYQLYQGEDNRPFSKHNRLALEFKTERASGILLYAVGGSPYHNHVTAALHSGVLHVSLAFGEDDLDFSLGIGLDDNRWHNLTIVHAGRQVTVYLDRDINNKTLNSEHFYLSLDPLVYVGGGDNFVITRGLPVTRNFVGCLKNVYFNDQSILYRLYNGSQMCTYHGGEKPTFGCSPVQDIPISFPTAASALRWSLGSGGENLTVEFKFRTVRDVSILFYVELVSTRTGGGRDYGLIEVWVIKGQPMLMFMPSIRNKQFNENITLPLIVNDNNWHSMHIQLQHSQAKLKIDAVSKNTRPYGKSLGHKGQVILGFGLRGYKQTEGYVGCMEQVVIQGKKLDPIQVVESSAAIGLRLDGCYLVHHCLLNNICEHGSQCLSDWSGPQCLCLDDSYEGKACHFPRYPPTCDSYYQAGHNQSGVYLIDVDGQGPHAPRHVECAMGSQRDGHLYGATIIEHNFALGTPVRGHVFEDRRYDLTYREMTRMELIALGSVSLSCEQYFKYTCQQAPVLLGKKTWFKSANGQVVDYMGSPRSGYCTCPESDQATCDGKGCYCDHGGEEVQQDEGYSHSTEQLPIMEMTFLQNSHSQGTANMTLGPFTCWGRDSQHLDNLVTMTTGESHVKLDAWTHGDLGFHFKTHLDHALLLMQTSRDVFGNRLIIRIVSEHSVEFYLHLNGTVISETLKTHRPLNVGDWHSIYIEHDTYNIRLSLDTSRTLVPLDAALTGAVDFNSTLYLGGLPPNIASNYREKSPGFSGCMRALLYNGREMEFSSVVDGRTSGVSTGCMSSCWPNPCEHGGVCKERWGEYTCQCQDPWAHRGHNCEYNLNSDSVTFSGTSSSFLMFNLTGQSSLDQTVVLSFRTLQPEAILFYAYDHLSNFIQLQLQRGNTIVYTYNTYRTIVSGSITARKPLNDGKWKQVIAEEYYNLTRLTYADQSHIIGHKRIKLTSFFIDPFKDSALKESVFIARKFQEPDPFLHLFVGGVLQEATTIPFLRGCVRGMRIGNHHINLGQGVLALGNSSDLAPACDTGCHKNTCENNGHCYEHWRYGNFTCDCSESDYSGLRCEKEASVYLEGWSVLEHTFTLPVAAQRSVTEQLMFHFRTTGTQQTNHKGQLMDMVLVYIKSTENLNENENYILVKLDGEGNVFIETNQGVGIYSIKLSGNFANGDLHELVYKREGSSMYLTLDGVREASAKYPDHDLEKIDTIIIGGLRTQDTDKFHNTANFTGCISNTVYIPESNVDLKIRSLKDFHHDKTEVVVHGDPVVSCSQAMLTGREVTQIPETEEVTTPSFEILTMPAWEVGAARLVTLSPRLMFTSPPSTSTTPASPTIIQTNPMLPQHKAQAVDDLTVIIAVTAVAIILVIAVVVALFLLYKRRQQYRGKKEGDMELRQPLNCQPVPIVQSSPVPPDHLARLDEFSMISATLGPKATSNGAVANNTESSRRHSLGSGSKAGEETTYEHPIFNKRKQRPASSISEVLEELERRHSHRKSTGSTENIVGRPHGEGELEWDPLTDRTPLTYEDITFFNTPLLAPIPDENEDSHVSSLSEQNSIFKEKPGERSSFADDSPGNVSSVLDGNGDSGYEAESRPEITEDDVTNTGDDDDLDDEDDCTDPKLYMYNISSMDSDHSPVLVSPSRQRLLPRDSKDS